MKQRILISFILFLVLCNSCSEPVSENINVKSTMIDKVKTMERANDGGISYKPYKEYQISDEVSFSHYGNLEFTGRVFDLEEDEVYGQRVLKLYVVYGKKDSSDYILENSRIRKAGPHEYVFPIRSLYPRFIKNAKLTIFEPEDELCSLATGDYISIKSMWGEVSGKRSSKPSAFGVHNYLIYKPEYSIERSPTKIDYEKPVFIKDHNDKIIYTKKEYDKAYTYKLQLPEDINETTEISICLVNNQKVTRPVITFNNCNPSELVELRWVHVFEKNSWLVVNTKNGTHRWQMDFFSGIARLYEQESFKKEEPIIQYQNYKLNNTPYHYKEDKTVDHYELIFKVHK